ncbi:MAG: hypothetical protein MUF84_16625 [Anaerolineae bacterium]|jgi:hypothetical protein|nr:hypothetical protein [Anaerolineae bacterium]
MNSNRRQSTGIHAITVVVLVMSLLVAAQAVAAATIPQMTEPVRIGPYAVSLVSAVFPGDHTSTWTYKIEVVEAQQKAVSHASLGLIDPDCLTLGYSADGNFLVEDPAQEGGIPVIKWNVLGEGIKNVGEFYTFSLTILGAKEDDSDLSGTYVAVKYGTSLADGHVEGPICGTTAVRLTSVAAQSGAQSPTLMIILALGATVATAGALRRAGKSR